MMNQQKCKEILLNVLHSYNTDGKRRASMRNRCLGYMEAVLVILGELDISKGFDYKPEEDYEQHIIRKVGEYLCKSPG